MNSKSFLPCILAGAAGAVVASLVPLLISPSKADTKLLPFQGRLSDAGGNAIADGAKVVEFKMYDAPTGGSVKWAGEVHKLSVNGGLVNTMLGSKAGLGSVDFSTGTFLQITVDANGDGQITAADPPLLPRQSVVPSIYANVSGEAWKMTVLDAQGKPTTTSAGWSALFDTGNPATGKIDGTKLATGTVGKDQLGVDAVETPEIKNGSVTLAKLNTDALDALGGTDSITSLKIKDGTITSADIAPGGLTSDRLAADYDSGWFDVTILKSYSKTLGFNDLPRFVTAYYKLPNGEIFLWGTESYADDHSLTGIALDFDGLGKLYVRSYGRSVLSVGSLRNRLDTGFESIPEAVSCQFRVMAWR